MVVKYSQVIRLQWKQSEINAEHFLQPYFEYSGVYLQCEVASSLYQNLPSFKKCPNVDLFLGFFPCVFKYIILLVKQFLIHMGSWWLCLGLFFVYFLEHKGLKGWTCFVHCFVYRLGDGSASRCVRIKRKTTSTLENYQFYACDIQAEARLKLIDGCCFIFTLFL